MNSMGILSGRHDFPSRFFATAPRERNGKKGKPAERFTTPSDPKKQGTNPAVIHRQLLDGRVFALLGLILFVPVPVIRSRMP
jgi:hypothetical protein